jgi:hypothetical protein
MKKFYVTLITALVLATSSVAFSGNGRHGTGQGAVGKEGFVGTSFVTPRDFGTGGSEVEFDHQRNFNQPPVPGNWSTGDFQHNWTEEK